jgi:cation diffusion facilitator family transporter
MYDHTAGLAVTSPSNLAAQRRAMRWSLGIGIGMFLGKGLAYALTGSAAILSDAAESVVHVVAVAFAAYSLRLSQRPPDHNHLYGYERISFFSAGFEGAMIVLAALFIIYEAIYKWIAGLEIKNLDVGVLMIIAATGINGILGLYLIRVGKRAGSIILIANGKHVLTDSVTSFGAIAALILVWLTGRMEFDPILAIAIALQILWTGGNLITQSFHGLMDESDPEIDQTLRQLLSEWATTSGGQFHGLRHRSTGSMLWIEVHLLFPGRQELDTAHAAATALEDKIEQTLSGRQVMVTTHLEPLELHPDHHPGGGPLHATIEP